MDKDEAQPVQEPMHPDIKKLYEDYFDKCFREFSATQPAPVQEPVAWMNQSWIDPDTRGWQSDSFESIPIEGWLPIYTTPPQRTWVGLTDEEIKVVLDDPQKYYDTMNDFARAIEAKLKEHNA
jgi:hypothetical protein